MLLGCIPFPLGFIGLYSVSTGLFPLGCFHWVAFGFHQFYPLSTVLTGSRMSWSFARSRCRAIWRRSGWRSRASSSCRTRRCWRSSARRPTRTPSRPTCCPSSTTRPASTLTTASTTRSWPSSPRKVRPPLETVPHSWQGNFHHEQILVVRRRVDHAGVAGQGRRYGGAVADAAAPRVAAVAALDHPAGQPGHRPRRRQHDRPFQRLPVAGGAVVFFIPLLIPRPLVERDRVRGTLWLEVLVGSFLTWFTLRNAVLGRSHRPANDVDPRRRSGSFAGPPRSQGALLLCPNDLIWSGASGEAWTGWWRIFRRCPRPTRTFWRSWTRWSIRPRTTWTCRSASSSKRSSPSTSTSATSSIRLPSIPSSLLGKDK